MHPAGDVSLTADLTAEATLTKEGTSLGTLAYMSPEQARGQKLDARTDIFSFGAVLYEMASGVAPFRGESATNILDSILNRAPTTAARLNPDLPIELERIISKALEKDRDLRYQHAADLRSDLQRLKRDNVSGRLVVVSGREEPTNLTPTISPGPLPSNRMDTLPEVALVNDARAVETAKRRKFGLVGGSVLLLMSIAATGYGIYSVFIVRRAAAFENFKITGLQTPEVLLPQRSHPTLSIL